MKKKKKKTYSKKKNKKYSLKKKLGGSRRKVRFSPPKTRTIPKIGKKKYKKSTREHRAEKKKIQEEFDERQALAEESESLVTPPAIVPSTHTHNYSNAKANAIYQFIKNNPGELPPDHKVPESENSYTAIKKDDYYLKGFPSMLDYDNPEHLSQIPLRILKINKAIEYLIQNQGLPLSNVNMLILSILKTIRNKLTTTVNNDSTINELDETTKSINNLS